MTVVLGYNWKNQIKGMWKIFASKRCMQCIGIINNRKPKQNLFYNCKLMKILYWYDIYSHRIVGVFICICGDTQSYICVN